MARLALPVVSAFGLALSIGACKSNEPVSSSSPTTAVGTLGTVGSGAGAGGSTKASNPPPTKARNAMPRPDAIPAPADVAAPPADAERTPSGLASKVLSPGQGGNHPGPTDRVTVHYTGWQTDGEMFDSSVTRGQPATFPLNGVIAGWTEGVQLMTIGEKRRFWIPENLAYGGRPGAPSGMLVFDVELISMVESPRPPATPDDVAAAPRNAERTASGIASRVLQRGTGTRKPTAESVVRVHYSGWQTTGEMFDSSITRGEPVTFPLGRVIPGWREAVQLMVEGEKRRVWIPPALAYEGRPGPQGTLVFDIELLQIVN